MDTDAPGWDAITAELERIHPGQEPQHWGTIIKWRVGGKDPLDGVSAYACERGAMPHWHFVSYGLSELYVKESDDPAWSGWGFELSIRVARAAGDEPPIWPINFMQNLARYVFQSGNVFVPGDHLDLNGPMALDRETAIRAALFGLDPELGEITTPHGRLRFVEIVGVTLDELEAGRGWNTQGMLDVIGGKIPLWITDLARQSVLRDPACAAEVARRTALEGSSTGAVFLDGMSWKTARDEAVIEVGASAIAQLVLALRGRIPFDRGVMLATKGQRVQFEPGPALAWERKDAQTLVVRMPAATAVELADALKPRAGTYRVGRLRVDVVPSYIRDANGDVVQVIGE